MSPSSYARLTRLALWALAVIVVTGAAVRLTGSGLGCSDWPTCEQDSLIAPLEYHALVEFGNRLFTGVVAAAVIAAVLGSWRRLPRRTDLIIWSCGLVAGVVGQVLLGALLVRTELDPRFVMGHFLLSMVLLWNAAVLDMKARVSDTGPVGSDSSTSAPASAVSFGSGSECDRWTRLLLKAVFIVGAALLVTGALVTGSGPHAGDTRAERLPLLVRDVARIHSVVAIGLLALVVTAWARLRSTRSGHRLSPLDNPVRGRRLLRVAILLVVQGVIGYTQYFSGVPALLVGVHVAMASVIWIEIVKAAYSTPRSSGDSSRRNRAQELAYSAVRPKEPDEVLGDSGDVAEGAAGESNMANVAMMVACL